MASNITIRYAASDQDVVAVHRFLCVVAGPTLPGPIDPMKSATEVWRATNDEVVLMAVADENLVGTLGLIRVVPWWGSTEYLANRFFFTLPGTRCGKALLREAKAIAVASDLECHIISEDRGKVVILNRSKLRDGYSPLLAN